VLKSAIVFGDVPHKAGLICDYDNGFHSYAPFVMMIAAASVAVIVSVRSAGLTTLTAIKMRVLIVLLLCFVVVILLFV
jgi:hypothetical protein